MSEFGKDLRNPKISPDLESRIEQVVFEQHQAENATVLALTPRLKAFYNPYTADIDIYEDGSMVFCFSSGRTELCKDGPWLDYFRETT